jgi:hypothetical protein
MALTGAVTYGVQGMTELAELLFAAEHGAAHAKVSTHQQSASL